MHKNTNTVIGTLSMDFNVFISELKKSLKETLPGEAAQMIMAPVSRDIQMKYKNDTSNALEAAVLILFFPESQEIFIPFIKRPEYDGVHSGQIAFPGGRYEIGDENIMKTALREAHEEIGINYNDVSLIGTLSKLYIPPSNYLVTPVVGYSRKKPQFSIDPQEVDQLLLFSLNDILNRNAKGVSKVMTGLNLRMNVPSYDIDDHIIWGATAMIISELISVIRK